MRYKEITIINYKGIKNLTLDLNIQPNHKIYTLIGLNESGKTTILEAINDFEFEVAEEERHRLIPKSEAGGFTGFVRIKAKLMLNAEDKKKIETFIKEKVRAKEITIDDEFIMERSYEFNNSNPTGSKFTYIHFIHLKKTAKSKSISLSEIDEASKSEIWFFIKKNLFPEVIFYRDFLSKFPEKIYLDAQSPKEKEYLSIIEDVLTSINPAYNIQESLLKRLSDPTSANKQALEAVENQAAAKISNVVFDAWSKIQKVSKKEIVVKTGQENGRYFMQLNVKEGHQSYAISERSLGFRWFFTFLLYTEFRKERIKTSGEILFLLDEPASNLHQAAQKSLLDTFETITTKSRLIYTTHSHHLINPLWLNAAYIIKNKGLIYKQDDDFNSSKTEVEAYKYKQFIAAYPTETSYFQPILDVLDYQPGLLELIPRIVITEGKFDYFVFRYFKEIILANSEDFFFYPGHGATALDLPIALYESWGKEYLVVLDADKEGREQKKRYIKEISSEKRIFTLEDVDLVNKNLRLENLFSDDERLQITREFNPGLTSFNKSAFNAGLQMLLLEKRIPSYLSKDTKKRFNDILKFIAKKISA